MSRRPTVSARQSCFVSDEVWLIQCTPNHSLPAAGGTGHPSRDHLHQQDVQCLCRRVGVAGPQLSSTVRCPLRTRSAISLRFASIALLVTLFVWAIFSNWFHAWYRSPPVFDNAQLVIGSSSGLLYVGVQRLGYRPTAVFAKNDGPFYGWFHHFRIPTVHSLHVPIWFVIGVFAIPSAFLWRRYRDPWSSLCPRCQYPIGASARCTECGERLHAPV